MPGLLSPCHAVLVPLHISYSRWQKLELIQRSTSQANGHDLHIPGQTKIRENKGNEAIFLGRSFQVLLPLCPCLLSLWTSHSASSSTSSLSTAWVCEHHWDTRNYTSTESYKEQLRAGRRKCTSGEELCCYTSEWHKPTRGCMQLRTNTGKAQCSSEGSCQSRRHHNVLFV